MSNTPENKPNEKPVKPAPRTLPEWGTGMERSDSTHQFKDTLPPSHGKTSQS